MTGAVFQITVHVWWVTYEYVIVAFCWITGAVLVKTGTVGMGQVGSLKAAMSAYSRRGGNYERTPGVDALKRGIQRDLSERTVLIGMGAWLAFVLLIVSTVVYLGK